MVKNIISSELLNKVVYGIRELAEKVSFDEGGGYIHTYHQGLLRWNPLPSDVNESILELLVLAEQLEGIPYE